MTPRPVDDVAGLDALIIYPEAAAAAHREQAVAPFRGVLPATAIASMQESLSGACTVEIDAFDAFAGLLADDHATSAYDHVIFDTAPTGHTLRALSLPGAWADFIDTNTRVHLVWASSRACRPSASSTRPQSPRSATPR